VSSSIGHRLGGDGSRIGSGLSFAIIAFKDGGPILLEQIATAAMAGLKRSAKQQKSRC